MFSMIIWSTSLLDGAHLYHFRRSPLAQLAENQTNQKGVINKEGVKLLKH